MRAQWAPAEKRAGGAVRLETLLTGFAALSAMMALIGWLWPLAALLPRWAVGFPAMVPVTSALVLGLCVALWANGTKLAQASAAAVVVCAIGVVACRIMGPFAPVPTLAPGIDATADRASIGTMIGLGLIAVPILVRAPPRLVSLMGSAAMLWSLFCLLGLLFDARALFDVPLLSGMSLPTALSILALALALLLQHRAQCWMGILAAPGASGRAARQGVLVALTLPVALGLGLKALVLSDRLSVALGVALMAGIIMAASVATVLAISHARLLADTTQRSEIAWLRTVFDTTGVAAMVFDAAGHAVLANRLAEDLTARSGGPVRWLRETRFFVPGTLEPLTGARHPRALLGVHDTRGRHYVGWIDPDRGERDLGLYVHQVDDVPGRGRITILTVTDETESWSARDHITRLERLDAAGLMAASASHEFGNIFGALQLSADVGVLQTEGAVRAQFQAVSEACLRGTRMTQRLLDLSRDGSDTSEPLDLASVIREVEGMLNAALAGEAGLMLDLPDQPVTVIANRADLVAVLMNLVMNGRDAIRDRPGAERLLWLRLGVRDGAALIRVIDAGAGMSADTLARATTPFYTSRETGTGLGLSMAESFARRGNGSLSLDSAPGTGTRVTVRLPLAGTAVQGLSGDARGDSPDLAGLTLLVVEDDPQFHDALSAALLSLGVRAVHETRAEAALARLEAGEFCDVLLSDIRLPGAMTGIDLARRAARQMPDLPVLLMAGYHDRVSRGGDAIGAMVLRKPISLRLLANAIRILRPGVDAPGPARPGPAGPIPPQRSR